MPELQNVFKLSEIIEPFAHDLGNILQQATTETDEILILGMGTGEGALLSYAETVSDMLKRSSKLLRQVRNSVGSLVEVAPTAIDLGVFFQEDRDWVRLMAAFRGQGLRVILDLSGSILGHESFPVSISKRHWLVLLENLLQNSLEAYETESQDRVVRIALANRMCAGYETGSGAFSHAVVSVTDAGCGFKTELADDCCTPFFTTKPRSAHHGLGLSESLGIARHLGGTLSIDSHVSAGAIVRIFLPLL